jgi:ribonuclease J
VRLIPLGGLGEFGLNALVLEWSGHRLLVDAGVLFAGAEMPGVDKVVPDFAYLADRPESLHGILLTHGHEDHIGALSFALQAAPAPVYGSPLTLGFARQRLRERGVSAELRTLRPGQPQEIGPFRVHPIRVAHSVCDSLALAIETPAGVVLASGDFKIDPDARPEERTDVATLAEWGKRGVLALLSDSTGVEQRGSTGCEDDLVPTFEQIFERTRGRVLVSCFATSIPRMQRVADVARADGRRVSFVGRRMLDNSEVARDLGLLRIPESDVVPAAHAGERAPDTMCLFVSGSQGEPLSALSMISIDEHKDVTVGPGDSVVLSARVIPGNERVVSRLIGNLFRRGCDVVHPGVARVHVSGHGSREDLLELLRLVRPQYLVPVHGEYRMLAQHAKLAGEAGLAADHVLLAEDGDVLVFSDGRGRKHSRIAAGRVRLDRSGGDGLEDVVLHARRQLSASGIVVPVLVLDRQTGRATQAPEFVTRGFVDEGESAELLEAAGRCLVESVESRSSEERLDQALTRERLRQELRRFFRTRTQRRPLVIPVVMEI